MHGLNSIYIFNYYSYICSGNFNNRTYRRQNNADHIIAENGSNLFQNELYLQFTFRRKWILNIKKYKYTISFIE